MKLTYKGFEVEPLKLPETPESIELRKWMNDYIEKMIDIQCVTGSDLAEPRGDKTARYPRPGDTFVPAFVEHEFVEGVDCFSRPNMKPMQYVQVVNVPQERLGEPEADAPLLVKRELPPHAR